MWGPASVKAALDMREEDRKNGHENRPAGRH
jgi:hypothetical protein